ENDASFRQTRIESLIVETGCSFAVCAVPHRSRSTDGAGYSNCSAMLPVPSRHTRKQSDGLDVVAGGRKDLGLRLYHRGADVARATNAHPRGIGRRGDDSSSEPAAARGTDA